jgi:uncharacterized protein (TIGR04255 family)
MVVKGAWPAKMRQAMSEPEFKLAKPPIIEAVLDIECDQPPGQNLAALGGKALEAFKDRYPKGQTKILREHQVQTKEHETAEVSIRQGVLAFQFYQEDEKQLVQVRAQGYSFNRLAPYGTLDDYLPEMERTWRIYVGLASPVKIREIRLRSINRILLPLGTQPIQLEQYFRIEPRLQIDDKLTCVSFLNHQIAVEAGTNHLVTTVLAGQPPEGNHAPILFDNYVAAVEPGQPEDWPWILAKILALRALKNRVFRNTLTEKCLNLFQQL